VDPLRLALALVACALAACTAGEVVDPLPDDAGAPSDLGADIPSRDAPSRDVIDAPPPADAGAACAAVLCPLHATCMILGARARCVCDGGHHLVGTACVPDAPVDLCLGVTCSAHGRCLARDGAPSCVCDPGYRAAALGCVPDATPDPCQGVSCSSHGTCVVTLGAVGCVCERGYRPSGINCLPESAPSPCDGVSCSSHGRCVLSAGVGACLCDAGFRASGLSCVPEAMADPCVGVSCSSHGRCVSSGSAASCACEPGYRPSGLACVPDAPMDPCAGVACSAHGRCAAVAGAASCACDPGYRASGLTCLPASAPDPCASVDCNGHGRCLVSDGAAVCHCDPGFASRVVPTNCQPVAGTVCEGVSCGSGTCVVRIILGAMAECSCDPGFVAYGMACVPERRLYCRDAMGARQPRGTTRCAADDSLIEVCRDADGDGFVEWAFGVTCNAGTTCSHGCREARCPDQPCPLGTTCLASTHGIPVGVCVVSCGRTRCGNCSLSDFGASHAIQAYCGNRDGAPATTACESPCPNPGDGCIPYDPPLCYPIEGCFSGPPR
jgi:hypothetical protein